MIVAYIWEYAVRPEHVEDFLQAYGSDGTWVQLFHKAGGFVRTELLRDTDNPLRFVTMDYWTSEDTRERFMEEFREEYSRLDNLCATFTERESFLGTSIHQNQ